jgi:hypothetical protein
MMPLEMLCMPSLEKVGMLYGKNDEMPLYQEFHYESIFT